MKCTKCGSEADRGIGQSRRQREEMNFETIRNLQRCHFAAWHNELPRYTVEGVTDPDLKPRRDLSQLKRLRLTGTE